MAQSTQLADVRAAQLERLRTGIDALLESNRFYQTRLQAIAT